MLKEKLICTIVMVFEDDTSTLIKTTRRYDIVVLVVVGDTYRELYYVPDVVVFVLSPPPLQRK